MVVLATLACILVGSLPAVAQPRSGPSGNDSAWLDAARSRLKPVSKSELSPLQTRLAETVAELDARMSDIPDGARWRAAWHVDALQTQTKASSADIAQLKGIEAALALPPPPELKAAQHAVRDALRFYVGAASLTSQSAKQFEAALALLDGVRNGTTPTATAQEQQAVREAFQQLAETHRLGDLLDEFRASHSQPNYRLMLTDEYVRKRATRHFEAPLSFSQQAGRIHLQVEARAKADISAELIPNAERAEIRVLTKGLIPATIHGSSGRLQVTANSTQDLTATQTLYLGPDGIETPGPQVCDCSQTALACLELCSRFPFLQRIGERLASRIVANQLAKHDPEIANKVEQVLEERIGEEGYDIAFRLNGTFRKLYSDRLPKQADEPRLRIFSDAEGVHWSALYANYDEVGTLAPPPVPASSLPFDMVLHLHESAIQSWASSLGGALLDEATFLNLLREDMGLESPTITARERVRRATVIRFADQNPLQLKFGAMGIELKLLLHGFLDGSGPYVAAPKTVTIRYQLAPGPKGLRLVRNAEDFSQDAKWGRVLEGFFPAEWAPVPQYANAAVGEKLLMRYLKIEDGWIIVGSSLSTPKSAAADAAGE